MFQFKRDQNLKHVILKLNNCVLLLFAMSCNLNISLSDQFSVEGIDKNADGIRDDVEVWISKLEENENVKNSLRESARIYIQILKSYENEKLFKKLNDQRSQSDWCLRFTSGLDKSSAHSNYLKKKLREIVFNTPLRNYLYDKAYKNIDEGIYSVPDIEPINYGLACKFKINQPEKIYENFLIRKGKVFTDEIRKQVEETYRNYPYNVSGNDSFHSKRRK